MIRADASSRKRQRLAPTPTGHDNDAESHAVSTTMRAAQRFLTEGTQGFRRSVHGGIRSRR